VKRVDRINRQRLLLIVVLGALFVVLFVLIGGMNSVHTLPGKRLPNPFADLGEVSAGTSPGGPAWGADAVRIFIQSLFALGAAVILLFVIISREHRKQFAIIFVVLLLIALGLAQIHDIPQSEQSPQPQEATDMGIGDTPPVEQVHVDIPPVAASNWQIILIALGSSLVLTGIGLTFFLKIYPALRSRHSDRDDLLGELGKSAGLAAYRIIAGDDPREAILRCYKEMTEIMSQAQRIPNYSYFTPREFATHLRERGMKDDYVDRLTGIFESVRYGGRSGVGFVDEAVACLQSIQRTYAVEGEG